MIEAENSPLTASHIHIKCIGSVGAPHMLWMGIWVHHYSVKLVDVGAEYWEIEYGGAQIMMLWCHD